jgi:hypothetical protein
MLTRQHYILFADMLKNIEEVPVRLRFAAELVTTLKKDNPRFNEKMFRIAANAQITEKGLFIPRD